MVFVVALSPGHLLKSVPLFNSLTDAERTEIASIITEESYSVLKWDCQVFILVFKRWEPLSLNKATPVTVCFSFSIF